MTNYVCAELDQNSANGDGISSSNGNYVMCKTWVVQQSMLTEFAITKAEATEIALSLSGFFVVCIAFAIIVKAVKLS